LGASISLRLSKVFFEYVNPISHFCRGNFKSLRQITDKVEPFLNIKLSFRACQGLNSAHTSANRGITNYYEGTYSTSGVKVRSPTKFAAKALTGVFMIGTLGASITVLNHSHLSGVAILEESDGPTLDRVLIGEKERLLDYVLAHFGIH
jgi:hypothetical protein